MNRIAISIIAVLLTSCAKHVPVKPVEYHETFAFRQETPTTVLVSVYGPQGEREAKEYLCTRSYTCIREDLPVHVYRLTRVRK